MDIFHYTTVIRIADHISSLWYPFGLYIAPGNIIKCKNYQQCIFSQTDGQLQSFIGYNRGSKIFLYRRIQWHNKGRTFLISWIILFWYRGSHPHFLEVTLNFYDFIYFIHFGRLLCRRFRLQNINSRKNSIKIDLFVKIRKTVPTTNSYIIYMYLLIHNIYILKRTKTNMENG